ncbi:hypothetical protein RhiirB3_475964, partial [Rhizophagus irregularis]
MDINEVIEAIERKLGKMQKISQQGKQYGKINLKLVMEIRCTEEELMNTWGILLKNRMIKIEPINYKNHVIRQRGKISASVLDIPNEIDELEVAKILRQTGTRYWYKSNNKNKRSYQMNVYFNNEEDRKAAIGRKIKIKDQIFTWFFRAETGGRQQSNFRQQGSNFRQQGRFNGRYQGQSYNRSFDNRARCYICKKNNHNANECYFNNDNNNNTNEHRSYRKENQNRPFRQESDTMAPTIEEETQTQEDDSMIIILEKMTDLNIEDTNKENITNNITTMITTDVIQENILDTTATVAEATTEIGTKEVDSMIGVEWLDAIDWQPYQNTLIEEEIGEKGDEGDRSDASNTNRKIKFLKEKKNKKREINENQKQKEKIKDKNNNLKIGCINVRGMNDNVKQGEIRKFLGKEQWDIAIISETKLKESKGKHIYMDWNAYECINSSYNNENTKNGILILLKKEINDRRYAIEKINGHAIKVDILFRGSQKNIRIIGIYNPNNDKPATKIIETKLAKWMNEATNLDYEMIILGDFNESANDRKKKREKPITTTIKQHGLQDIHECLTTEKDVLDTWRSGEYSSRIDFIFLSEGVLEEIISHEILDIADFKTDHRALTIKIKIKEKLEKSKIKQLRNIRKEIKHIKLDQKDWNIIAEEVEQRLEDLDQNTTQISNRDQMWNKIVEIVNKEKKIRITEIKRERNDRKEKESISDKERTNEEILEKWIDEYEHLEKISNIEYSIIKAVDKVVTKLWRDRSSDQYKYSFKEFEENLEIENWGTTDTGNHIAIKIVKLIKTHDRFEKRNDYSLNIDKLRNHKFRKELKDREKNRKRIMDKLYGQIIEKKIEVNIRKRELYLEEDIGKMINKILERKKGKINMSSLIVREKGKITIEKDQKEIKTRVLNHYKEWTRKREIDLDEIEFNHEWRDIYSPKEDVDEDIYENLMIPIRMEELESVLNNLKSNKAPGQSGISYDFWKKSKTLTRKLLLEIINDSMLEENAIDDWKKGIIYPINKTTKSDWNQDLSLTRPIVLLETARKI